MNFYDLKRTLYFPGLAGAIKRRSDCYSLRELNLDEARAIRQDIEVLTLNKNLELSGIRQRVIDRLERIYQLHMSDIEAIEDYIRESKITE